MAIARWKDLCIDAADAHRTAAFWGELLGLEVELHDDGDAALRGATPEQTIWVNAVPEPRTVKQRVHLDIETPSLDPVLALGATVKVPASESGLQVGPAPRSGGRRAVRLRPRRRARRGSTRWASTPSTPTSAARMARWWAEVIGGEVVDDERGFSWIEDVPGLPFDSIDFAPVPEPKTVKNRIHWDITSDDLDGILARGATVLAEPTEATPWHVLADPEGNEFCVFPP